MGSPVLAESPDKFGSGKDLRLGDRFILETGEETVFLGQTHEGLYRFRTTLGAPKYIPGTTTRILTSWSFDVDTAEWVTKDNIFSASVKNGKVTVEMEGQKLSWDPAVSIGGKKIDPISDIPTTIIQDPINENYYGNTLKWDYTLFERHLRQIEGVLQEFYIFNSNPGGDVQIKSNSYKDKDFIWEVAPFAYDANGEPIEIVIDGKDKVVKASEFNRLDIEYPITIDPTETYTTSASDGHIHSNEAWDSSYSTQRNASTGSSPLDTYTSLAVGQYYNVPPTAPTYRVFRAFIYFDTSGLPDSSVVSSATLKLYGKADSSDTDFYIQIQTGGTYPHDPLVTGDYYYTHYSGDGGTLSTSGFSTSGYNSIALSATGLSWISLDSSTKLVLRSKEDVDNSAPSGAEWVTVYAYEQGTGYWPQLEVTYSATNPPTVTAQDASDVSTTTAILHGYISDDGGAECQVKFLYDTDSGDPYAHDTGWLGTNYTSSQAFQETVSGLNVDDTYYFIAQAQNDAGTDNSTELSFDTLASLNPPTNFKTTPRSGTEVSISWTKGVGSSYTLVRYKVGEYPTSLTDGTVACNITQSSYTLEDLIPGTTYWVKAWGYDAGDFSTINATDMATTFLERTEGDSPIETPPTPHSFFGPPSYDGLSNLPIYENFNARADDIGISRGNFWMFIFFAISIVVGVSFWLTTKQPIAGIIGTSMGIAWGWMAGPIPGVWVTVYAIGALALLYVFSKVGGEV